MSNIPVESAAFPLRELPRGSLSNALSNSTALSGSFAQIMGALIPAVTAGAIFVSADALAQTAPVAPNTLPSGGTIVGGTATITQPSVNKLQINQSSDKAIIDWRTYSIGSQAWVNYTMPGSGSVSLNRVTGGDVSYIMGKLTANGTVMLINPSGIVFGKGSVVDVAGLVATTANVSNSDFMAGRMRFVLPGKPGATVINEGDITIKDAGVAAMVAPGVANRGTIVANLGTVSLAAGNTFTLDLYGDGLVRLAVTDPVTVAALGQGQALVQNSGIIKADGGKVLITAAAAKNVVDTVINMSGVVQARRVTQQADGTIILDGGENGTVAVTGKIDVSAQGTGVDAGKVTVTGQKVQIAGTARIDATAQNGRGGTVKIGGDYQGKGTTRQAQIVTIDAGALIDASAIQRGDGGTVVVWSTDTTTFNGIIMAKGGQYAGNGGLVETSGHTLAVGSTAKVDISAPAGQGGMWLLDPTTLTIQAGAGSCTTVSDCNTFAGAQTVDDNVIEAALAGGDVTLTASVSIIVNEAVSWNANNNALTLNAPTVVFNAPVTGTGNSSTDLIFGALVTSVTLNAAISADGGITPSGNITTVNVGSSGAFQGSIQTAVDIVNSGGTVNVAPGLYTLTDPLLIQKSLTLVGNPTTDAVDPAEGATPYPAPQAGASDAAVGSCVSNCLVVIKGSGQASEPAIRITDGGGQGVALNVTIRGFVIDGNTNHAIDAEVSNSGVLAGSSFTLSRNTILGASEPAIVQIQRFETVNILYNMFPKAVANVVDIQAVGTAHIVRNVILAQQESNPGNDDVAITVGNLTTFLDYRMNIIDGSFFPVTNGQPGLADGLSITAATATNPAVLIKNNYFNGLGRDAIVFSSGIFGTLLNPVTIYQNYIGGDGTGANQALRTDLLTNAVIGYTTGPLVAIKVTEPGPSVALIGNNRDGIAIESNAHGFYDIRENFLSGNNKGGQGLNLDLDSGDAVVNASSNWWGVATGPVAGTHYSGTPTINDFLTTGTDGNCINTCITPSFNEPFAFQQAASPPTTSPPTTSPPTTSPPTTSPPTTSPPTTVPPPPGQGQGPPFEVPPVADAFFLLPWVDLNFIDGLRTSFYMQPNGGPYYYAAFDSLFALNGQMASVLRGPLAPQPGAAPPVPVATTLGQLAPAAGPGSAPDGAEQPDQCAVNFMTNFWAWYRQCATNQGGPPQQ